MQVFIFGAAKGANYSETSGNQDFLKKLIKGVNVLDWTIKGLYQAGISDNEIYFIGGYNVERVIKNYPDLNYVINPRWETTHVTGSLRYAMQSWNGSEVLLIFADTIFRPAILKKMLNQKSSVSAGIDHLWKERITSGTSREAAEKVILKDNQVLKAGRQSITVQDADAQFTGLLYFDKNAAEQLHQLFAMAKDPAHRPISDNDSLTDLLGYILQNWTTPVSTLNVAGNWAEIDSAADLARFVFGTKAETLERIRPFVKKSIICDQVHFILKQWEESKESVLEEIQKNFKGKQLIIRSSSLEEDSWESSQAGAFLSIADVPADDTHVLEKSIDEVIEAFRHSGTGDYNPNNQVLVQPFISNVAMSGVAFSKHLEKATPYYLINYDDETGKTDTITSGSASAKSILIYKHGKRKSPDERLVKITKAIKELEKITGFHSLDIEFVLTHDGELYIVQVRPITVHDTVEDEKAIHERVKLAKSLIKSRLKNIPYVPGRTSILADMPDWNPAEMISIRPNPLALSLYQYLITDKSWRIARGRMGYFNPEPEKLLFCIAGHPYIDARNSFNNLSPDGLPKKLAEKLIDHYLNRLAENPHFHDKVEFEIVITCYTPDIDFHLQRLIDAGFENKELELIKSGLRSLTENAIKGITNPIDELLATTETLEPRSKKILAQKYKPREIPGLIQILLDDCIERGTIPFSILARYGFIASSMLRGLVKKEVITEEEKNLFLNSIETVAGDLVQNMNLVLSGEKTVEDFLKKFGHLRPGSYDINSYSYDERPSYYFPIEGDDTTNATKAENHSKSYDFSPEIKDKIREEIAWMGMDFTVDTLLEFIRKATAAREYAKFQFTKNLDKVLKLIAEWGENYGFKREEMAYIFIGDILQLATTGFPMDPKLYISKKLSDGKFWYEESNKVETPQIITSPEDLDVIVHNIAQPNFVTIESVTAPLCVLTPESTKADLQDKIVLIEGADPGYDWIFMHPIKGLITKYGGAASHMTIRCAEFGLPAAIGCGEDLFERLLPAKTVELNCTTKQIRVLG
jgi:glutamine kinase